MVKFYAVLPQFKDLSVEDKLKAAQLLLDQLDAEYVNPKAQLVTLRDELFKVLQQHGLARMRFIPPSSMGFHPRNRGSIGLVAIECHIKLKKFTIGGFSLEECARAASVQRNPTIIGDLYEETNANKARESGSMLPHVAPKSLESFSLTCSHTYGALRLGHFAAPSEDDTVADGGAVSKAKIIQRCPSLEDPLNHGINVLEICHQVETMHPLLIDMVIESDNVPAQAAASDNAATLLAKTFNLSQKEKDYDMVQLKLVRAAPNQDVAAYVAFAKGGWLGPKEDPWVLKEFEYFCGSLKTSRDLNLVALEKLAELDLGPPVGAGAAWRSACLKGMADAPARYIIGTENTVCNVVDVAKMGTSAKTLVIQADAYMRDAKLICADLMQNQDLLATLTDPIKSMRDVMDLRLFAHVLSKQFPHGAFDSLMEIASKFYTDMENIVGRANMSSLPKGWKLVKSQPTSVNVSSGSRVAADSTIGVAVGGPTKDQVVRDLAVRGAVVGAIATCKATSAVYTIKTVRENSVVIVGVGEDTATVTVKVNELFGKYTLKRKVIEDTHIYYECPYS